MFLAKGYFDESGDFDTPPGIFCISGYFIGIEAAEAMDREWKDVLDEYKIPFFHMVDCAHGNEFYADMSVDDRIDLVKRLIALIKTYTIEGFSIIAKSDTYHPLRDAPDVYSDCAHACALAVQNFLHVNRAEGNIAYVFEQGHRDRTNGYNYIAKTIKRPKDSLTFASKSDVRLLQAADILAWHTAKYAKDYSYARQAGQEPKRPPRKDFLSLMEHPHTFFYMGLGGPRGMGLELWPMDRRSSLGNTTMKVENDGPLVYLLDENDASAIPMIPVLRPVSWKDGPDNTAHLAFEGLGGKQFTLALDEPVIFETVSFLLTAGGRLFGDSRYAPAATVENLAIQRADGFALLRIKIEGGGQLALRLPNDMVETLKKALNRD
ncbi:hypothetical protein ACVINW_001493 [Bradyrhizobium sp. USDA 4461]